MSEAGQRVGATHLNRFLDQVRNHPAVHDGARLADENRTSVRHERAVEVGHVATTDSELIDDLLDAVFAILAAPPAGRAQRARGGSNPWA